MNRVLLAAFALSLTGSCFAEAGSSACGKKGTGFYAIVGAGGAFGKAQISLPSSLDLFDIPTPNVDPAKFSDAPGAAAGGTGLASITKASTVGQKISADSDKKNTTLKKTKGSGLFRIGAGYDYRFSSDVIVGGELAFFMDTSNSTFKSSYTTGDIVLLQVNESGVAANPETLLNTLVNGSTSVATTMANTPYRIISTPAAAALFKGIADFTKKVNPTGGGDPGVSTTFAKGEGTGIADIGTLNYSVSSDVKVKRSFGLDVSGRIGYLRGQTLFYAKAGASISKYKATWSTTESVNAKNLGVLAATNDDVTFTPNSSISATLKRSFKKTKTSIQPTIGLGMEYYLGKAFIRGEYAYTFNCANFTVPVINNTLAYAINQKGIKPGGKFKKDAHSLTVSVGYKF